METTDYDRRLTPAAREALDALTSGFRDKLLIAAGRSASSPIGEAKEISPRDIADAARRVGAAEVAGPTLSNAWYTPYRAYLMLAASIALAAAFWLLAAWLHYRLEGPTLVVVLGSIAFLGALAAIALARRLWPNDARELQGDDKDAIDYSLAFISEWHEVEIALRSLVSQRYGQSEGQAPASMIVNLATRLDVLTAEERHSLFELLTTHDRILKSRLRLSRRQYVSCREALGLILSRLRRGEEPTR